MTGKFKVNSWLQVVTVFCEPLIKLPMYLNLECCYMQTEKHMYIRIYVCIHVRIYVHKSCAYVKL